VNALLFAVGTGVLATLIWWVGVRVVRIWQRLRLRRLAYGQRRMCRRLLRERLAGGSRRAMSRRHLDLLARSFRVKASSRLDLPHLAAQARLDASGLIDQVEERRGDSICLVNADSGYGKTIFGLVLPLLRSISSRKEFFPCYVDLASADAKQPLARLDELLDQLGGRGDLWGRPLIVFDAPNETVDPEHFAEALAVRREDLAAVRARLLFLFSFRHHSYPARLRSALIDHGFDLLQNLELLFEIDCESDFAFFPELIRLGGGTPPPQAKLRESVNYYSTRFPSPPLSREDVAFFLQWCFLPGEGARHPFAAPSPACLCLTNVLGSGASSAEQLFPLARVAFHLLGREVTAATYREIEEQLGIEETELRGCLPLCELEGLVHYGDHHLRFEDETTVRVLGAVEVARNLIEGESPAALRGRTIYDVCAPYVQPALAWLARGEEGESSPTRLAALLERTLSDSDAPYSFYAGVLCNEEEGAFGTRSQLLQLNEALLRAMIAAIDKDRGEKCRGSLEAAGRGESELVLDPVLDQLFEVMAAYNRRAVPLLLPLMDHPEPLIRSQAAYLLLDRIDSVDKPTAINAATMMDLGTLRSIPFRMQGSDGNLHFRFHQLEVLERLLALLPSGLDDKAVSVLDEIASTPGDSGDLENYAGLQRLVGLRARQLASATPGADVSVQLREQLGECLTALECDPAFQGRGREPIGEARLECWEVALGMAVHACTFVPRNAELVSFVEAALDHEYWIVRWWAFGGLVGTLRSSCANGHRILAMRCAQRAVRQLYTGVEPMGLKHRQCAVIKRMRDSDEEAGRVVREALASAPAPRAAELEGQALAERYYEAMGVSPDEYLAEFFRRVDELLVLPS
jgi:hypothetical protein